MKNTHKLYTDVIAKSGSKNEPLEVTENGIYEAPKGTGYSPVKVNVKLEGNPLQYVIDNNGGDGFPSCAYLFNYYAGTSLDSVLGTIDTSKVTNMAYLFNGCSSLTNIPELDTSNVNNMQCMFQYCNKLTSIPLLDTSNVTNMNSMFNNCSNLTSIPALDASKATNLDYMFNYCRKLTSIGMYGFTRSIYISDTALGHDALVALLNQAGTAYDSSQRITMGSAKLALLSDEEKAIATNKGWTLA